MNEYIYAILVSSSALIILTFFMVKNYFNLKKQEATFKKNEK